jgi:hypothetical protein
MWISTGFSPSAKGEVTAYPSPGEMPSPGKPMILKRDDRVTANDTFFSPKLKGWAARPRWGRVTGTLYLFPKEV